MAAKEADHPFTVSCNIGCVRHWHRYSPPSSAPQRCGCGSRTWKVTAGGVLPIQVSCAQCGTRNRVATAYEQGRADAALAS